MPGARQPDTSLPDDDARISGAAAMIALGGHAAVVLAALMLAGRSPKITVTPNVVAVTLVSGEPGAAAPGLRRSTPPAQGSSPPNAPPSDTISPGERLDRLTEAFTPPSAASPTASANAGGTHSALSPVTSGYRGRSGSSRADQGLGQGEGVVGVDLYAAASLPDVGSRPATPPPGDLWRKVSPCWRPAASRPTTLIVALQPDGSLSSAPQSVRRLGAPVDAQTLLAERAATRALQACAPYAGLSARQWRVEFP
jgi:hypothetical protein